MEAKATSTRSPKVTTKYTQEYDLIVKLRELGALQVTVGKDEVYAVFAPPAPAKTLPLDVHTMRTIQPTNPDDEDMLGFNPSALSGRV